MAGRQDWEGGSGTSKLTKQILGLATGAALGYLAYYGASNALRYLEVGYGRSLQSTSVVDAFKTLQKQSDDACYNSRVPYLRGNTCCSDREAARSPRK